MLVNTKHIFIKRVSPNFYFTYNINVIFSDSQFLRAEPDPITFTMQIVSNVVMYCFDNSVIHWSKAREQIYIFS